MVHTKDQKHNKNAISITIPEDNLSKEYILDPELGNLFLKDPRGGYNESSHLDFSEIDKMMVYLGYNQSEVADLLDIDNSTVTRWKKKDSKLDRYRSEYIYKIDNLLSIGKRIFGNLEDLKHWLSTDNVALGNQKPITLIKNNRVDSVVKALHSLSWGNYL
ncbi:hypothetical protein I215_03485 [Galbibacter marinus]|uniref:Antitoxin Xre/MbcA/ParS-like toxin-binding domain-containing protein n=1 Tax=Galbibacter marinus TaxID=555500 RepID=K2PWX0_9FLAO|nr:antitoxin Xre/MbcA/ParS toxin-binding domain-containing protein [Galbibacter marinus]EKF55974.1 hypothetical protein I215_03485 [Galbibacter marinus]